jgi:hypothetical protein
MYFYQKAIKNIPIRSRLCILTSRTERGERLERRTRMANLSPSGDPGSRTAVASYVATLSADLAIMARRTGLETLGYLLEMVRLEAESASRHSNGPSKG